MIGGSPIPQPGYYPQYVAQPQPVRQAAPRLAMPQALSQQRQPVQPSARIRGQIDDGMERRSRPALEMPSPEQFGLTGGVQPNDVDWTSVRTRLERLQISSFHLQRIAGGYRFSCAVPRAAGTAQVSAEAVNEADAIDQALAKAELAR